MRRRRGTKFTIPSKYLLLILTALCVVMMAVTFLTDFIAGPLNEIAGVIVVPFQKGVSSVGGWISDRSDELVQIKDVLAENKKLKERINELTIEVNALQQDKYELANLRKLYSLDNQYEDYEKIGARIISKDSGNWFQSFVIDKGSDDGIEVDMNIIADGGLVGRVTEVNSNYSKVVSIIDDNSNVSAMVLSSSDRLIVSGDLELMNEGLIRFSQLIDDDDQVKEGDKIVTSQISDKYLPGILIGYINKKNMDENNLTSSGLVVPAVDFAHLEEVLVILTKKQEIDNS